MEHSNKLKDNEQLMEYIHKLEPTTWQHYLISCGYTALIHPKLHKAKGLKRTIQLSPLVDGKPDKYNDLLLKWDQLSEADHKTEATASRDSDEETGMSAINHLAAMSANVEKIVTVLTRCIVFRRGKSSPQSGR